MPVITLKEGSRARVYIDDVSRWVNEERNGNSHVAMPVKQLSVEKVVDAGDFLGGQENGQGDAFFCGKGAHGRGVLGIIEIHAQHANFSRRPVCLMLLQKAQLAGAGWRRGGPKMKQHEIPAEGVELLGVPGKIRQGKVRGQQRLDEPSLGRKRQTLRFERLACLCVRGRRGRKRFGAELLGAFLDFDAVVCGQILESLRWTTGPANAGAHRARFFSQPKEKFLAVLR